MVLQCPKEPILPFYCILKGMRKDVVNVYWAPVFDISDRDWTILYSDPERLLKGLSEQKAEDTPYQDSFFQCPSFTNTIKNIFVLKSPMDTHYKLQEDGTYSPEGPSNISMFQRDSKTLEGQCLLGPELNWVFFTEEDSLEMSISSPYFSQAQHLQYGSIVPGSFNIGKYFRHIGLEFNLWKDSTDLIIKENEPMAYVRFDTDKKVNLIRFTMSDKLIAIKNTTRTSGRWNPKRSLIQRYELFKKSRLKEIILKEIKQNII
jgi:hypothetical protein